MDSSNAFLNRYRAAFVRADSKALLDCFAFPLHIVSVADGAASVSVATVEAWPAVLDRLLGVHQQLGVSDCVPLDVQTIEPMHGVAVLCVQWALYDDARQLIDEFSATYTLMLAEGPGRIVAIVHNELTEQRAALQRR